MRKILLILICLSFLNSCVSNKKITYFNNQTAKEYSLPRTVNQTKLAKGDFLAIVVSASDLDVVRPFNYPVIQNNLNLSIASGNANGVPREQNYMIDENGEIEFPLVGKVKVHGLTIDSAKKVLKEKIQIFVKDPLVNLRILNFKITVLGEVNRPGTFNINDQNINILQAIGLAGDLTIYGERSTVTLIRENENDRIVKQFDLTNTSSLVLDEFNLKQNDVIYVRQNKARSNESGIHRLSSIYVSSASVIISLITLYLTRIKN